MRKAHGQDSVTWHREGTVDGNIRAGAGMWLQVGMLGTEEGLRALDTDVLGDIYLGATAVVALSGVTLGVLVRQGRAECCEHCRRREVLTGNELQSAAQALEFRQDH